jgi:hypothetical protein
MTASRHGEYVPLSGFFGLVLAAPIKMFCIRPNCHDFFLASMVDISWSMSAANPKIYYGAVCFPKLAGFALFHITSFGKGYLRPPNTAVQC